VPAAAIIVGLLYNAIVYAITSPQYRRVVGRHEGEYNAKATHIRHAYNVDIDCTTFNADTQRYCCIRNRFCGDVLQASRVKF